MNANLGLKVRCEKCGRPITVKQKGINTRDIGNEIQEIYFICPKCKAEFIIAKTNKEIRDLQKKIAQNDDPIEFIALATKLKNLMDEFNHKGDVNKK